MALDIKAIVNPRVLEATKYNMKHVTICWQHEGKLQRAMSNESAYPPLESVQAAVRDIVSKANWYPEDASECMSLREQLAAYASLRPENVTLGNGSMELLDILFQTFIAQPGVDEVIIPAPDYTPYSLRARFFGAVVQFVVGGEDTDKIADDILESVTPRTKFVLMSRPNNPTGKVMPRDDVLRILDSGVLTVVDEAYVELADEGTMVAPWINDWDNLIVLRTFSKGFGLAGLRLGYLLATPEIIHCANLVRHVFNVNLVTMAAAEASLNDLDNVRARIVEQRQTREWLTEEIKRMPGLRPIPSQGNFILVDVADSGKKATEFVEGLFERGIYVRDFSKKQGLEPDRYFRITVGQPGGMERLAQELRDLLGKSLTSLTLAP
ncbi:MAG: histidinol-phosphate transaminase [Anaerolineae bacterium]|nr:histidinol-phosphate transaminase [Anaerolineae bacterium]